MADDTRSTTREVRVDDPELSPEANRVLTDELRDAVGSERVEVPEGHRPRRDVEQGDPLSAFLAGNRTLIGITLAAAIVIGALCSVITGSWWLLAVAVAVHALATLAVGFFAIRATTTVEKPSPEAVARLEAEGVPDPEKAFNDRVQEYTDIERQEGAVTPSSDRSRPVGHDE